MRGLSGQSTTSRLNRSSTIARPSQPSSEQSRFPDPLTGEKSHAYDPRALEAIISRLRRRATASCALCSSNNYSILLHCQYLSAFFRSNRIESVVCACSSEISREILVRIGILPSAKISHKSCDENGLRRFSLGNSLVKKRHENGYVMSESANMQTRNLFGKLESDSEVCQPARSEDAVARPRISWPIVNAMEKAREEKPRLRAAANLPAVESAPVTEPLAGTQSVDADACSSEISAGTTLPSFLFAASNKSPASTFEPAAQCSSPSSQPGFWSGRAWAEQPMEPEKNSLDEVFARLSNQSAVPGPLSGILRYMSGLLSRQ